MKYLKINKVMGVVFALLLSLASSRFVLAQGPVIGGCPVLPADNIWNTPIDTLPVDPSSMAYINTMGPATNPHRGPPWPENWS